MIPLTWPRESNIHTSSGAFIAFTFHPSATSPPYTYITPVGQSRVPAECPNLAVGPTVAEWTFSSHCNAEDGPIAREQVKRWPLK